MIYIYKMKFFCKYCNYHSNIKCNYEKHLVTYKHHKNKKNHVKKHENHVKLHENHVKLHEKRIKYKCNCCNFITINKGDYTRHLKSKRHQDIINL